MEHRGICSTCVQVKTCIFVKDPPVWECEEFSNGNHSPTVFRQAKVKRAVSCEAATESE